MSSGEAGHEERPPSVAGPLDRHRRLSPCLSQTCSRAAEAGQAVRRRRGPPAPDDASPGSARRAGRWPARCSRRWCSQSCCRTTNGSIMLVSVLVLGALWATAQLIDDLIDGGAVTNSASELLQAERLSGCRTTRVRPALLGTRRRRPRSARPPPSNRSWLRVPSATEPEIEFSRRRPGFIDYLYLGFTNATAFSPTDAMPLAPWGEGRDGGARRAPLRGARPAESGRARSPAGSVVGGGESGRLPECARELIRSGTLGHPVTINKDGSPQVSIVWVGVERDELMTAHLRWQQKLRNVERDPRVALSFQGPTVHPPGLHEQLIVHGRATIEEGHAPELLRQLAYTYLGADVKFPPMPDPPPGSGCESRSSGWAESARGRPDRVARQGQRPAPAPSTSLKGSGPRPTGRVPADPRHGSPFRFRRHHHRQPAGPRRTRARQRPRPGRHRAGRVAPPRRDEDDGSPPLPRSDEAPVRTVPLPERGTSGALRAEGARLARAPVVAYLEEHAVALPGWLVAVDEALRSGEYAGASGEIHGLNPGAGISDAVAVMQLSPLAAAAALPRADRPRRRP